MVRTISIVLWLVILFYLLSTTASEYFSSLLEHLSKALNLSPAVAGVTLLAIGNGAPDVFSSVAAFVSSDTSGSIGFGAVLGSALFITTIVSGSVALATTRICKEAGPERINLVCFVRDALFLLASASVLMVILVDAKVYLWEALCFLCVYVVYAASVWAAEMLENRHRNNSLVLDPLVSKGIFFFFHLF
jgi:sodium/potassium/calcium exchanger 6